MQRVTSLDIFRGITVATMILVNNPGSWDYVYPPLEHAKWHGWTPTDMVFPFFLWISGVAMTLSFARRKAAGADKGKLVLHTARRAASIFGLGLLLNLVPSFDFATVRIPGVLQRIGICYFFATVIYLYTSRRGQIVAALGLIGLYLGLMWFLPFPGATADRWSMDSNAARYIDGLTLSGHMWSASKVWDPEGVLSTIPAIVTVLCGILTTNYLRTGLIMIPTGLLLGYIIPINKALWTPSYVVLMAGLASLGYWLVQQYGQRPGTRFFEIYGTNAIVSFVLSGMVGRIMGLTGAGKQVFSTLSGVLSPYNASLAYALLNVALCFSVVWWLHHKKIMVRL
jgi:predicted acyltransferase